MVFSRGPYSPGGGNGSSAAAAAAAAVAAGEWVSGGGHEVSSKKTRQSWSNLNTTNTLILFRIGWMLEDVAASSGPTSTITPDTM